MDDEIWDDGGDDAALDAASLRSEGYIYVGDLPADPNRYEVIQVWYNPDRIRPQEFWDKFVSREALTDAASVVATFDDDVLDRLVAAADVQASWSVVTVFYDGEDASNYLRNVADGVPLYLSWQNGSWILYRGGS